MSRLTNTTDIPLGLAVWLAKDDYDLKDSTVKNLISATTLLKSTRQIILSSRLPPEENIVDISSLVKSRIGQSIHTAIETAWFDNPTASLGSLGVGKKTLDSIRINPETNDPDYLNVYLEKRKTKPFMGFNISGKFDLVIDGELNDTKYTSVFTAMNDTKDEDYTLQGSIYRWLFSDLITSDYIQINWIFSDWKSSMVSTSPNYPKAQCMSKKFPLMTIRATEQFISNKLNDIKNYHLESEDKLPFCSEKELWCSDPVYKYYADPTKTIKSTKNFTNAYDAEKYRIDKGKGVVIEVPGKPKACDYCPAFSLCTQKNRYFSE